MVCVERGCNIKGHLAEMAPANRSRIAPSFKVDPLIERNAVDTRDLAVAITQEASGHGSSMARCLMALLALTICGPATVLAADYSLSGFGTLGFAKSDRPYKYQRFVDDDGSFRRDSVAGVQLDAWLTPNIGATVQALASPSSDNDNQFDGTLAWAFVSWRPTNDWLVRVGRQRIPLYLHSQNNDIGVTYDFARLPTEMYSISPGNDFNGVSVSKNWNLVRGDLVVDGYWGSTNINVRYWFRDGVPNTQLGPGVGFRSIALNGKGVVVSYRTEDNNYRIGLHSSVGKQRNGAPLPSSYPFVPLFPGVGYFQVDPSLPGPGIDMVNSVRNTIATLGADVSMGNDFRVIAEYARTYVNNSAVKIANASDRGYVSLLRKFGPWTPYVTYAFLQTDTEQRDLYQRVNGNKVPSAVPGATLINASQRAGADGILTYDQTSWAIGTSYALSPTSKIKAEWMRVRIGQVSSLVDAPPGSDIRNQSINVISLSYSVVF